MVLPAATSTLPLLGSPADRAARNRLKYRWLATQVREWLADKANMRKVHSGVPQSVFIVRDHADNPVRALVGSLALTTDGLGLTPGNPLNLIQISETPEEALLLSKWFDTQWTSLPNEPTAKEAVIEALDQIARHRDPHLTYALILHHLFASRGDKLDEEQIVKSATGIRNTVVWKKLYKFQRDGAACTTAWPCLWAATGSFAAALGGRNWGTVGWSGPWPASRRWTGGLRGWVGQGGGWRPRA